MSASCLQKCMYWVLLWNVCVCVVVVGCSSEKWYWTAVLLVRTSEWIISAHVFLQNRAVLLSRDLRPRQKRIVCSLHYGGIPRSRLLLPYSHRLFPYNRLLYIALYDFKCVIEWWPVLRTPDFYSRRTSLWVLEKRQTILLSCSFFLRST